MDPDGASSMVDPSLLLDATAAAEQIGSAAAEEADSAAAPPPAAGASYALPGGVQQPEPAAEPEAAAEQEAPPSEGSGGGADEPLPYGGDVQAAMRAQDRDAIRKIFAAREAKAQASDSPDPTSPPGEPQSLLDAELQMQSMRSSDFSPIAGPMGIDATASSASPTRLISPDPDISYGAPFPYTVDEIDGRTVGAHSMPAGGQHGLGMQYLRGRLIRVAPPLNEKFANQSSLYHWNSGQFWRELALQLLVAIAGPVGIGCAVLLCKPRGAQSRGFLLVKRFSTGYFSNLSLCLSLLAWLLSLPLFAAAVNLMSPSGADYDIDTFTEVVVPLVLLVMFHVVVAIKYAFLPPKELAWRRQNRRESSYLSDEQFLSWIFTRSERAMQWELELADWRGGGGLAAATFEFLPDQPADEPAAATELNSLLGSTAPAPPPTVNGLSKRGAHGRWAEPDAPAALQRPLGVPLRHVLQRLLRFGAEQRTNRRVAALTALVAILLGATHAAAPHVIRANRPDLDTGSPPTDSLVVGSSVLVGCVAMALHLGHLLSAISELRRRQLVVDIFAHMLSLSGHRHPSAEVSRFPLLVQDSTHNVHTWLFGLQLLHGVGVQYRLRLQLWCGLYTVGLFWAIVAVWHKLLFMANNDTIPLAMVALSVDTVLVSPLVFALCATAHTLNYSTQHHLGAFVRMRRRALYELAELEEAQGEAAERWHEGAARQLRQLERALGCAADEMSRGAYAGRGLVEFLGMPAGNAMTLFGLLLFLCSVGGAVGLAYTTGQEPLACGAASGGAGAAAQQHHDHTCVCQWPGWDDGGSASESGSGSWAF